MRCGARRTSSCASARRTSPTASRRRSSAGTTPLCTRRCPADGPATGPDVGAARAVCERLASVPLKHAVVISSAAVYSPEPPEHRPARRVGVHPGRPQRDRGRLARGRAAERADRRALGRGADAAHDSAPGRGARRHRLLQPAAEGIGRRSPIPATTRRFSFSARTIWRTPWRPSSPRAAAASTTSRRPAPCRCGAALQARGRHAAAVRPRRAERGPRRHLARGARRRRPISSSTSSTRGRSRATRLRRRGRLRAGALERGRDRRTDRPPRRARRAARSTTSAWTRTTSALLPATCSGSSTTTTGASRSTASRKCRARARACSSACTAASCRLTA